MCQHCVDIGLMTDAEAAEQADRFQASQAARGLIQSLFRTEPEQTPEQAEAEMRENARASMAACVQLAGTWTDPAGRTAAIERAAALIHFRLTAKDTATAAAEFALEYDALRTEQADVREMAADLRDEVTRHREAISFAAAEANGLRRRVTAVLNERDSAVREASERTARAEQLRDQSLEEFRADRESMSVAYEVLRAERDGLRQSVQDQEGEHDRLSSLYDELSAERDALRERVTELERVINGDNTVPATPDAG